MQLLLLPAKCSCFTSVYLTLASAVCTMQLFHFTLPDTSHWLLLSAQQNCFTSVYLKVTAFCTTQLFHFSLPTGYCCLHNAIVSLQSSLTPPHTLETPPPQPHPNKKNTQSQKYVLKAGHPLASGSFTWK